MNSEDHVISSHHTARCAKLFGRSLTMDITHLTPEIVQTLRFQLESAAVKCSERCLYQSAKWYVSKEA